MKKVIVKKDFSTNKGDFVVGDELTDLTIEQIMKLNEKGFIEPLSYKDLVLIERELNKKEEEL